MLRVLHRAGFDFSAIDLLPLRPLRITFHGFTQELIRVWQPRPWRFSHAGTSVGDPLSRLAKGGAFDFFPQISTILSNPSPPANPFPRPTCTPLCPITHAHSNSNIVIL